MKTGQQISPETIAIIASQKQLQNGRLSFKHPRCGLVVLTLHPTLGWYVETVEKPNEETK